MAPTKLLYCSNLIDYAEHQARLCLNDPIPYIEAFAPGVEELTNELLEACQENPYKEPLCSLPWKERMQKGYHPQKAEDPDLLRILLTNDMIHSDKFYQCYEHQAEELGNALRDTNGSLPRLIWFSHTHEPVLLPADTKRMIASIHTVHLLFQVLQQKNDPWLTLMIESGRKNRAGYLVPLSSLRSFLKSAHRGSIQVFPDTPAFVPLAADQIRLTLLAHELTRIQYATKQKQTYYETLLSKELQRIFPKHSFDAVNCQYLNRSLFDQTIIQPLLQTKKIAPAKLSQILQEQSPFVIHPKANENYGKEQVAKAMQRLSATAR